ncbi:hypothetical protein FKP32DRAFT_1682014, partial [Trametes sanguinea]
MTLFILINTSDGVTDRPPVEVAGGLLRDDARKEASLKDLDRAAPSHTQERPQLHNASISASEATGSPTATTLRAVTIGALSPELFCEVLMHLPPVSRLKATHVCRSWRDVSLANPRVWRLASLKDALGCSYALTKAFLERSKDLPTSLVLDKQKTLPMNILEPMLQTVAKELPRLQHLRLQVPPETPTRLLLKTLRVRSPML